MSDKIEFEEKQTDIVHVEEKKVIDDDEGYEKYCFMCHRKTKFK